MKLPGRLGLGAAAVLLVLSAAFAFGEWRGWPWLARPLESFLSGALHRGVHFSADTDAFRARFLGHLRMSAAQFEIDAPAWSSAPRLLQAHDVTLELGYADLWRAWRGAQPHVRMLHAGLLDLQLERLADGRASWQFGDAERPAPQQPPPTFGDVQIAGGTARYSDALLALELQATAALSYDQPQPLLKAQAKGRYRQAAMSIDLVASGDLPWAVDAVQAAPVPVTIKATIGRSRFEFDGQAIDVQRLRGLNGRFQLSGPSLAAVGDPLGVTLPTTGPFRTEGRLTKDGELWHADISSASIGSSRLNGSFSYDGARAVPLLTGRLGGPRLLLVDLGPAVGTTPKPTAASPAAPAASAATPTRGPGKVLPDRPFDLPSLRAMDADVAVDIGEVDLNTRLLEPLHPLRAHLRLADGVLSLNEIDARTSGGRLLGELRLDGRASQALWNARLRWDGVQLEHWIHQTRANGAPPYVTGRLLGSLALEGRGRSTAEILGSLKGKLRTDLQEGTISHLAIEAAGIDVAQSLGVLIKGDEALPVPCAVADLVAEGGLFKPRVFVLDATDSVVLVDGSLSLADETLDLRAVVAPRDFSLLALRTPLHVRGSFANPTVSLEKGPVGARLALAAVLGLLNPAAALLPLVDASDNDDARRGAANCQRLQARIAASPLRQRTAVAATTTVPTTTTPRRTP